MRCSHFHLQKKAKVKFLKSTSHCWNLKSNLETIFPYNMHLDILSLRHFMWNDHCLGLSDLKSTCLKYACNITVFGLVILSDCEGNLCLVVVSLSIYWNEYVDNGCLQLTHLTAVHRVHWGIANWLTLL